MIGNLENLAALLLYKIDSCSGTKNISDLVSSYLDVLKRIEEVNGKHALAKYVTSDWKPKEVIYQEYCEDTENPVPANVFFRELRKALPVQTMRQGPKGNQVPVLKLLSGT